VEPIHYKAETFIDERGQLNFFNDLNLEKFKRIYYITHNNTKVIRAWQGHKNEAKLFKVTKGVFVLAYVKLDSLINPCHNLTAKHIVLEANKNEFLYVPAGYANGLKALEKNSMLQVFSSMRLEDSLKDKVRFEPNQWFDWNKY
jgi:dTDP-4-dehydrorhamnose 3,5-epimerase